MTTPYECLANAIVAQAAIDYKEASLVMKKYAFGLRKRPRGQKARYTNALLIKKDCMKFFRSDYFATLTDVDPDELMERLNQMDEVPTNAVIGKLVG